MLDTREELVWVNNVMSLQLLLNAVCPDAIPWTVALIYILASRREVQMFHW